MKNSVYFFLGLCVALASPLNATAAEFYIGADVVQLKTHVNAWFDNGSGYNTKHIRVSGGYEILDYLTFEVYMMNADDSEGSLCTTNCTRYWLDTGTIYGFYIKPKMVFQWGKLFALLGYSKWTTEFANLNSNDAYSDSVQMVGYGYGAEFDITNKLVLNVEVLGFTGSADYGRDVRDDLGSRGISVGISYLF